MITISTLVVGERYRNYAKLLLHSININSERNVNVCITHDGDFTIMRELYPKLNIYLYVLSEDKKKYFGGRHFPFFLKNEAIKNALSIYKNGDHLIHLDCDSLFYRSPYPFLDKVLTTYKREGIYQFKNHGFKTIKNRSVSPKLNKLFEDFANIDHDGLEIHKNPTIMIWLMEGFIIFNIDRVKIVDFCKSWDDAINIIIDNNLCYRPDSNEIAYSCLMNDIEMNIIQDYIKKTNFAFLKKSNFDGLFLDNTIPEIYHILSSHLIT